MKYKNKKVGNFRSKLEQFCAKELTTNNIPYEYEAWKVELLPKFTFPNICYEKNSKSSYTEASEKIRSITYTPDFVGSNWIIETKGKETSDFILKWKMFKNYLVENNLNYMIFKPTNQKQIKETVKIILNDGLEQNRKIRSQN